MYQLLVITRETYIFQKENKIQYYKLNKPCHVHKFYINKKETPGLFYLIEPQITYERNDIVYNYDPYGIIRKFKIGKIYKKKDIKDIFEKFLTIDKENF